MTVASGPVQGTFDELGTPLSQVTFVVVDLETTGGSPADCGITEVGAVKIRGGEVVGEFATLVDPGCAIPPFIAVLTGITDAMVAGAPRVSSVLPAFLEFSRGAVLVAHNALFDVGFLRAACAATGQRWPGHTVIDTARLARQVLTRDEVPNCKLGTLARHFQATTVPCHRALDDARATVDVLHGLLERVGSLGVHSLEELVTYSSRVHAAQRRKRYLAEGLPSGPGVYMFTDAQNRVLYVGRSVDVRTRVRTYFTASESRSRMGEMVGLAESVTAVPCSTGLEAEVRELRLIAAHKPRYNRRSRFPERALWLKLTVEAFPRLSVVRQVREDGAPYLGPFGSRRTAEQAMAALHEALPLRQCTTRLSPRSTSPACALAEMGRCGAPCEGGESVSAYAQHVQAARAAMLTDARRVVATLAARVRALGGAQRYEDAATHRDRLATFLRAASRTQRLAALTARAHLVAARPTEEHGWEVAVVRYGRLAAAGVVPPSAAPRPYLDALVATAETVTPGPGPTPAASAEETECILRWLERPGTRLVESDGAWECPAYGAGGYGAWLDAADAGRRAIAVLEDQRGLRPVHRPAR
ncbi:MAG: DEDD exonuclease domain-containing protein [Actinomycetes bacterium]